MKTYTIKIKGRTFTTKSAEAPVGIAIINANEYAFLDRVAADNLDSELVLVAVDMDGKPTHGFKQEDVAKLPWDEHKAPAAKPTKGAGTVVSAKTKKAAKGKPATKTPDPTKRQPRKAGEPTISSIILAELNRPKGTTRQRIFAAIRRKFPAKKEAAIKNTMGSLMHTLPIKHKLRIKKTRIDNATAESGRWLYTKF